MTTIPFDGQLVEQKRIIVNNAHLVWVYLEKYDPTTNAFIPWTAAPSPAVAFCTDRQGDAVITSMGPFTLTEVSASAYPGWYYYAAASSVTALLDVDAYRGATASFTRRTPARSRSAASPA